jgi:hypothetical protein
MGLDADQLRRVHDQDVRNLTWLFNDVTTPDGLAGHAMAVNEAVHLLMAVAVGLAPSQPSLSLASRCREIARLYFVVPPLGTGPSPDGPPRGSHGWYGEHRYSLILGLALSDDALVEALVLWPDHDVIYDEGAWGASREDVAAYIEFCRCASGRAKDMSRVRKRVTAARQKRATAYVAAVDALLAGDAPAFGSALATLVELHRDKLVRERKKSGGYHILGVDASILWMLAGSRGIDRDRCGLGVKHLDYLLDVTEE